MKVNFGKDVFGNEQVFEMPTEEELLMYLKVHLGKLKRNPNDCPKVLLELPAMHVYALLDLLNKS